LHFERDFKCTFLCFDRPELRVYTTENGGKDYLGKVKNPFMWCDLICDIYLANNEKKYAVTGSCCQCGIICEGPFCQEATLDIKAYPGMEIVGNFKRVKSSILINCLTT